MPSVGRLLGGTAACVLLAACGGGGAPSAPAPPVPTAAVSVVVYYDQNRNALRDPADVTRVGGVVVQAGGASARSQAQSGQASLSAVPQGAQTFRAATDSLPPFFVAGEVVANVPVGGVLDLPLTLPIGSNQPATYLAEGDSITVGDGSFDHQGYLPLLEERLRIEWGQAQLINEGQDGGKSFQGDERIAGDLSRHRPAYVLVLFGTNDWNRCRDVDSCYTQESLRSLLRQVKAAQSLPFLGTILPANTDHPSGKAPPGRNEWVAAMNERLKLIAREEGAVPVDLFAAFMQAAGNDLSQLFVDHVHPNDRGYRLMADEWFKSITTPRAGGAAPAALDLRRLLANPPGGYDLNLPDD